MSLKRIISGIFIFLFVGFCLQCGKSDQSISQRSIVENLRAFAKLYGYVRYFHPSDEAASLDWNRFVYYGVSQIKESRSKKDLKQVMEQLFYPIAPTIRIFYSSDRPKDKIILDKRDNEGLKEVYWQHYGVGFGRLNSIYKSLRVNRDNFLLVGNQNNMVNVFQKLDAGEFRGKRIKFMAQVKTDINDIGDHAQLWLRVDRENGQLGFFDNMSDRPITTSSWEKVEIQGRVDDDAASFSLGCMVFGTGKFWLDDFKLFIEEENQDWIPVPIKNNGFENSVSGKKPGDWHINNTGYLCEVTEKMPLEGEKSLFIQVRTRNLTQALFVKRPKTGEMVDKPLDAGLSCMVPLVLFCDENGTLGKNAQYPVKDMLDALALISWNDITADDENLRLADVIITWNVFQHFYPYFNVVDTDWDKELTLALQAAQEDQTKEDFTCKEIIDLNAHLLTACTVV